MGIESTDYDYLVVLKGLCKPGKQASRARPRLGVDREHVFDTAAAPSQEVNTRFERRLDQVGDGEEADSAPKKGLDRDLIGGVQHGRCASTCCEDFAGEAERRKALQVGGLESQRAKFGEV